MFSAAAAAAAAGECLVCWDASGLTRAQSSLDCFCKQNPVNRVCGIMGKFLN